MPTYDCTTKTCRICEATIPLDLFPVDNRNRDGHRHTCLACETAQRESLPQTKACASCGIRQPLSNFQEDRRYPDGHWARCKPCMKKYRDAYNQRPEAIAKRQAWVQANPDKISATYVRSKPRIQAWKTEHAEELTGYFHDRYMANPERAIYRSMVSRCTDPANKDYAIYGGRGITICDRWLASVETFLAEMGPRPSPLHSLDRISSDGPYNRENCRWATRQEQARNRRTTMWITHDGLTLCAQDWADRLGMNAHTLRARIRKGMSVEDALFTPLREWDSKPRQ
jgi:hypothetical protein